MNAIQSIGADLLRHADATVTPETTLEDCRAAISQGIEDFQGAANAALLAGIHVGHFAARAKDLLKHGEFSPWIAENFGPGSARPMTHQWVTACMRAAEVADRIASHKCAPLILADEEMTIEKMAGMRTKLDNGLDPVEAAKQPTARQARLKVAKERDDSPDTGKGANVDAAQAKHEKALEKRERALDAYKVELDAREVKLATWESDLKAREKALKAAPKAAPALPQGPTIDQLKAAKLANDQRERDKAARGAGALLSGKAAESAAIAAKNAKPVRARAPGKGALMPASAATSADQAAPKGDPAPEPKMAPETADAIRDAAQRAVGEASDKAMDQPHHGHAPEGDAGQPDGAY